MNWDVFFKTIELVTPGIMLSIPNIPPILVPVAIHAMQVAEQSNKSGADKKAVAMNLVHDGIEIHNAINKEHPLETNVVVDAVGNGIDAVITSVKAVQKAKEGLPPTTTTLKQ